MLTPEMSIPPGSFPSLPAGSSSQARRRAAPFGAPTPAVSNSNSKAASPTHGNTFMAQLPVPPPAYVPRRQPFVWAPRATPDLSHGPGLPLFSPHTADFAASSNEATPVDRDTSLPPPPHPGPAASRSLGLLPREPPASQGRHPVLISGPPSSESTSPSQDAHLNKDAPPQHTHAPHQVLSPAPLPGCLVIPQDNVLPWINPGDNPNMHTHIPLTKGSCRPGEFQVLAGVTCVLSPFLCSNVYFKQLASHGATPFLLPFNFNAPLYIQCSPEIVFVVPWTKEVGCPEGCISHREHFTPFFERQGALVLTTVEIDLWITALVDEHKRPEMQGFIPPLLRAHRRPPEIFWPPLPPSFWTFTRPLQHPVASIPKQYRVTFLAKKTPLTHAVRYYFAEAFERSGGSPRPDLVWRSGRPEVFTESPITVPVVVMGFTTLATDGNWHQLVSGLNSDFQSSYWTKADIHDLEGRTPRSYLELVLRRLEGTRAPATPPPYIVTLDWAIQIMTNGEFVNPAHFALSRAQLQGLGYQAPTPTDMDYSYVHGPWPDMLEKARSFWPSCCLTDWEHLPTFPRFQCFSSLRTPLRNPSPPDNIAQRSTKDVTGHDNVSQRASVQTDPGRTQQGTSRGGASKPKRKPLKGKQKQVDE